MEKTAVLLVEDNPDDAYLIREYLSDDWGKKYEIVVVDTLAAAMQFLVKVKIDVVLLDLSLPDSSGLDTVRTVVSGSPDVAIVILTGLQDEQVALQSLRYGAQDYLDKGQISPSLLSRSLMYAIERKKITREKENLLTDLSRALEQIELLQGILPICAACKKIHNTDGTWNPIEEYISRHSKTVFSHGICPDCAAELYPELALSAKKGMAG